MINCTNCGAPLDDGQSFCSLCGQPISGSSHNFPQKTAPIYTQNINPNTDQTPKTARDIHLNGYILCKGFKEQRFFNFNEDKELSNKNSYSSIFGGTVLYGIAMNLIICFLVENNFASIKDFLGDFGFYIALGAYLLTCIVGAVITFTCTKPITNFVIYNLVVLPLGFIISIVIDRYGLKPSIITNAVLITLTIIFIITIISIIKPKIFEKLIFSLLVTFITAGAVSAGYLLMNREIGIQTCVWAGVFSLYISYQFSCALQFPKTKGNAITCALDIYLDIFHTAIELYQDYFSYQTRHYHYH